MELDNIKIIENELSLYRNNLFGFYNSNNVYTISEDVIADLVECPKLISGMTDDKIQCTSYISGVGNLQFEIEILSDGKIVTTNLYLVENEPKINGAVNNTIKTIIAVYTNKITNNYFDKVLFAFNIHDNEDTMKLPEIEEINKMYIYSRKNYNEKIYIDSMQSNSQIIKELLDEQLQFLSKSNNEFASTVLDLYKSKENELLEFSQKNNQSVDVFTLFELLNYCVNVTLAKNPKYSKYYEEYNKSIAIAVRFAMRSIKDINKKTRDNLYKSLDDKEAHKLMKLETNMNKAITNMDQLFKTEVKLGKTSNDSVDSFRRWRRFRRGDLARFRELKQLDIDGIKDIPNRISEGTKNILQIIKEGAGYQINKIINVGKDYHDKIETTIKEAIHNVATKLGDGMDNLELDKSGDLPDNKVVEKGHDFARNAMNLDMSDVKNVDVVNESSISEVGSSEVSVSTTTSESGGYESTDEPVNV